MNKTSRNTKLIYTMAGVNLGAILALGMTVMAENSELDSGPRVFPYNGVLELDGTGFTGQADFQFTLTDDGNCDFIEAHDAVSVSGGRFSVNIGAVEGDLPTCIFDSEQMFIQIAVREGGDNQPHRTLTGRQRIHPVPFAYWAAEGSDFRVDGTLTADALGVDGNATVGNLSTNGTITTPRLNGLNTVNANGGDVVFGGNIGIEDSLGIAGDIEDPGGNTVEINDNLSVAGTIVSTGNLTANSITANNNIRLVSGDIQDTNGDVVINDGLVVTGTTTLRGNIQDNTGDVTINDNLDISGDIQDIDGDVIVNDNMRVTGVLLRRIYGPDRPPNGNIKDSSNNNINENRAICFITRIDNFNENSDDCTLGFSSGNWTMNNGGGACTVMCYSWR